LLRAQNLSANVRVMIKKYIETQLERHADGAPHRFDELWDRVPDFSEGIRDSIAKQNSWIYLSPQTFDGWYLIQRGGQYELYFQEKGQNCWGTQQFSNERDAMKALLKSATDMGL